MIVRTALRRNWLTGTVLLLIGGLLAEEAAARTSCSYAGAPTNALTVTVQDDSVGEIKRSGSEITVRGRGKPLARCAGGTPTVLNIDTMNVVLADLSFV